MSMEHEMHAAVVAEMRSYTNECNDGYHTDYGVVCEDMRHYATRLEAAHRREVAQLREALEKAEAVIDGARMMILQGQEYDLVLVDFDGALAKCRDALAATETKGEANGDR